MSISTEAFPEPLRWARHWRSQGGCDRTPKLPRRLVCGRGAPQQWVGRGVKEWASHGKHTGTWRQPHTGCRVGTTRYLM